MELVDVGGNCVGARGRHVATVWGCVNGAGRSEIEARAAGGGTADENVAGRSVGCGAPL